MGVGDENHNSFRFKNATSIIDMIFYEKKTEIYLSDSRYQL